jgi:hypothetical protein
MAAVRNTNEVMQERLRQKREREEQHRCYLDALLTEHDVARLTKLSVASIRRRRLLRQDPKFIKLNFAVRYRSDDVQAWIASLPSRGGQSEGR